MSLDIFNPQISVVAHGLEGKVITVYGGNNLGKTKQAARMPKPLYIPMERGLNAIAGVPFMRSNSWAEFKKINKQFKKNADKAKEVYNTVIIDSLDAFAKYATRYVCNKYGVERLKDGNDGYGLWTEYATEVWEEVDNLLNVGLTVIFIAHAEADKSGKVFPKGDKRTLAPIIDNSDIVVYLQSNGVDEDGNVIKSSGYLAETEDYFARSRFDYIDTYIQEYTSENLEKAIIEAIERQESAEGIQSVTFDQQKQVYASEELDYDTLLEELAEVCDKLQEQEKVDDLVSVVEKHLGKGKKLSECTKQQVDVMSIVLDDLKDLLSE